MRRISQPLFLMMGVQTLCLGIGFWFQYQLTVSTTEYDANESVWSELVTDLQPIISAATQWQASQLTAEAFTRERAQAVLDSGSLTNHTGRLLTDTDGKLLCLSSTAANRRWAIGDQVTWQSDRGNRTSDVFQYGHLLVSDGELPAIAYHPSAGGVYVVAFATETTIPAWRTSLLTALSQASVIAFAWAMILCTVATSLLTARFSFKETHRREERDHEALRSAQDLLKTRDAVIFGLAKLAESRDPETGDHLERISLYTTRLAMALRPYPKYQRAVTPTFIRLLGISSVLHDIGKVGLEDTVLLKPGRLTVDERKRMQQHTLVAGDCLKEIEQRLGASNFLQTAREIALYHHERWDGAGYPTGLAGDSIPLAARIVSIADVYDALRSKRIYKNALPHEECVQAIREGAGTQFDPELVEVFLDIEAEFGAIAIRFANEASAKESRLSLPGNPAGNPADRMSPSQEATLREVTSRQLPAPEATSISVSAF